MYLHVHGCAGENTAALRTVSSLLSDSSVDFASNNPLVSESCEFVDNDRDGIIGDIFGECTSDPDSAQTQTAACWHFHLHCHKASGHKHLLRGNLCVELTTQLQVLDCFHYLPFLAIICHY